MNYLRLYVSLLAGAALPAAPSSGQTAVVLPATSESDSTVVLSPFEVSSERDVGYRAATTAAGSRMNEDIVNIPASVSVMTSEFLQDIGALDLLDASQYMVGGGYAPSADIDHRGFNFRGIRTPITFRNMFSWFSVQDNFSTDRIDVVRGPNSLLFGVAPAGGLANVTTKRAQFKDFVSVTGRVSSFDGYRFTVDANHGLGDKAAVRLNLLWSSQGGEQRWDIEKRQGVHLAGTWKPFPNTTVRVEGEYLERPKVLTMPLPRDQFTNWDETPYTYNAAPAPFPGIQRPIANGAANSLYVYIPSTNQLLNARGWGQTVGPAGNSSVPVKDESIVPRELNMSGPDWKQNITHWTETIMIEQRIGDDLVVELAANEATHRDRRREFSGMYTIRRDPNPLLPGTTTPNPYFRDYYVEGQYSPSNVGNDIWEARLSAIYDWKPERLPWMEHKIFASVSRRDERYYSYSLVEKVINNPIGTDAIRQNLGHNNNRFFHRRYLSLGDDRQNTDWTGTFNDPNTGVQTALVSAANGSARPDNRGTSRLDSMALSASSAYLDGRLRTLIGVRKDTYTTFQAPISVDPLTNIRTPRITR